MQKGQAVLESLVLLIILGSFFIAVIWIGKIQDISLQLTSYSRHLAFRLAHQGLSNASNDYIYFNNKNWSMRDGSNLIKGVNTYISKNKVINFYTTKGLKNTNVIPVLNDFNDSHDQIWQALVKANLGAKSSLSNRLHEFDRRALNVVRQTSILQGNGTAYSDIDVKENLANSSTIWLRQSSNSIKSGQNTASKLSGIDQAWGRTLPEWDWLGRWVAKVPEHHLLSGASQ